MKGHLRCYGVKLLPMQRAGLLGIFLQARSSITNSRRPESPFGSRDSNGPLGKASSKLKQAKQSSHARVVLPFPVAFQSCNAVLSSRKPYSLPFKKYYLALADMALQMKYQEFLSRPTTDALAPGASLHYIPTAVTITEPAAILKHFATQNQQLKKKENFLNVTEGPNGICAETETTIQFEGGGGTFLPGLDDNFLADRTVSLPVVCQMTKLRARDGINHCAIFRSTLLASTKPRRSSKYV